MITSADGRDAWSRWIGLSDRFEPPARAREPISLPHLLLRRPSLLLAHVGARMARLVEEALTSLGMDSREFDVLALLVLAEGSMAQQTIAGRTRSSQRRWEWRGTAART